MKKLVLVYFFLILGCASVKNYESEEINLSNKGLRKLPQDVLKYKGLKSINLRGNRFKEFPIQLTQLLNLETIIISDNSIDSIPSDILKLKKLKYLYLDENRIRYFRDLSSLDSLKFVTIIYNPLRTIKSLECYIPNKAEIRHGYEFPTIKGSDCK